MNELQFTQSFETRVAEWKLRGKPEQNGMDWRAQPWIETFPKFEKFLKSLQVKNLGYLDRTFVRAQVSNAKTIVEIEQGFLTAMIWGYAENPVGPSRIARFFNDADSRLKIVTSHKLVSKGKIKEAYDLLVSIKYLGPAFATKFMYFAAPSTSSLTPVILDSLMSFALERWANYSISSQGATSEEYLEFLETLSLSAEKYDIKVDQLEFILFSEEAKERGNQSWSNRASSREPSENEKLIWGLLLAKELMLRDSNFYLSFEEPGGGQYRNLTIRSMNPANNFQCDMNLVGSIICHSREIVRFEWNHLFERGAAASVELLAEDLGLPEQIAETSTHVNSISAIAETLIHNLGSETKFSLHPVVCDNSVYGIRIEEEELSPYGLDDRSFAPLPICHGKPAQNWFWSIRCNGEPARLIDTFNGLAYRTDGTVLTWQ